VHWRRKVVKDYDQRSRCWQPRKKEDHALEEEKTILICLTAFDLEQAVANKRSGGETLLDIVSNARAAHGHDYQVFLLVQNLNAKAKAKRSAENASWQAEVRGESGATSRGKKKDKYNANVSMDDIERELVMLTVAERDCFVLRAEKPEEAVDWLVEMTKDIAYRPYKCVTLPCNILVLVLIRTGRRLERDREAFLNIDGRIESNERGNFTKTYTNQLACMRGVTEPAARAIVAEYPTWNQLFRAYEECRTVADKKLMLQHISVRQHDGCFCPKANLHTQIGSNLNGAATLRHIGKAVSERVYITLFTANRKLVSLQTEVLVTIPILTFLQRISPHHCKMYERRISLGSGYRSIMGR